MFAALSTEQKAQLSRLFIGFFLSLLVAQSAELDEKPKAAFSPLGLMPTIRFFH